MKLQDYWHTNPINNGMLGIIKTHNFNSFYGFILYMTGGIIGRAIYCWLVSIEQSQPTSGRVAHGFSGLQHAATKPLDNDKKIHQTTTNSLVALRG